MLAHLSYVSLCIFVFHGVYVTLTILVCLPIKQAGVVNQGGLHATWNTSLEESTMKQTLLTFRLLTFRTVLQHKFTVVLLALFMFGLVGGGSVLLRPASAYAASDCRYYTVKAGDTLSYIGQAYHSTVQHIAAVNHIANVNLIFPGERFCIPTAHQTSPVTTTPTKTASGQGTISQPTGSVATMISQVFGANAPQALSIAQCESGLNPNAYNPISIGGSHAEGVFQILYPSTWSGTPQAASSPYDAWANIQAAHAIFVRDGYSWREWTCQ